MVKRFLHWLGNKWLTKYPVVKTLSSGVFYRATTIESYILGHEMFVKGLHYNRDDLPCEYSSYETFCDLGCNVGYFTCWLQHHNKSRKQLMGLMVDANPAMVEEARWHANTNGILAFAVHGIVGEGADGDMATFWMHRSNICSTSRLPHMANQDDYKPTYMPCVNLEAKWKKMFHERRCNILKMDIEGSELGVLQTEGKFLARCDVIIIEWHKYSVQLSTIKEMLAKLGLRYVRTTQEAGDMGTAIFKREC